MRTNEILYARTVCVRRIVASLQHDKGHPLGRVLGKGLKLAKLELILLLNFVQGTFCDDHWANEDKNLLLCVCFEREGHHGHARTLFICGAWFDRFTCLLCLCCHSNGNLHTGVPVR